MKRLAAAILFIAAPGAALAQAMEPSGGGNGPPIYTKFEDLKWQRVMPSLGEGSPESAILHTDPQSQASQLMLRVPKNFRIARHWHNASEALAIVSGALTFEDTQGNKVELGPGSFLYIPRHTIHEARTQPDQGALIFISTDGPFDINWAEAPPAAAK